jgi:DNA-binding response OmpR family regulator
MTDLHFGRVRTCLFDPAYMNRQSTVGALQTLGFVDIEPIARAGDLESALAAGGFQLLIAELQGHNDQICDTIRRLRHRCVGPDPFLVTILTTWENNADIVRLVVNSGTDALLARPYTIAQLGQRVTAAVLHRQPFVVTADYVGPSRRAAKRVPEKDELFAVPNSLRAHATGEAEPADFTYEAWNQVLRWKVVRLGRQLESTARLLIGTAARPTGGQSVAVLIERLAAISSELLSYAAQTADPAYAAVVQECAVLGKSLVKPDGAEAREEREVRRLHDGARALAEQVRHLTAPVPAVPPGAVAPANETSYFMV